MNKFWFKKYLFLASLCLVAFVLLGFFFNNLIIDQIHKVENTRQDKPSFPPNFLIEIVYNLEGKNLKEKVDRFQAIPSDMKMFEVALLDKNLNKIAGTNKIEIDKVSSFNELERSTEEIIHFKKNPKDMLPPPPKPGLFHPGGPPPFPRPSESFYLVRSKEKRGEYLLINLLPPPRHAFKDRHNSAFRWIPLLTKLSLTLSLVLGFFSSLLFAFFALRRSSRQVDHIIDEINGGNLKARFDIQGKGPFKDLMLRFNTMADEIENLVIQLQKSTQVKNKMLQELAHDLRTPIASLNSILDTLKNRWKDLDPNIREEFLGQSVNELNYFSKLVDNLLFLSQLEDSNFTLEKKKQDIVKLSEEILETSNLRIRPGHKEVKGRFYSDFESLYLKINADQFTRLLTNALENAYSFADSEVHLKLLESSDAMEIEITDNGPGFTPEALESFGKKKASRSIDQQREGRISIGIGSLVMDRICQAHAAKLQASNLKDSEGQVIGACVKFTFPL